MATTFVVRKGAPRSPGRGDTIKSLRSLQQSGFHNADTGTELQPGEAKEHLHTLEQKRADRITASMVSKIKNMKLRSRGREWIPSGDVVFRTIHGHRVPFKKKAEPFL